MKINELLESLEFNGSDYVKEINGGKELDFDLVEDLVYFMNNDDDTYRRHVYPSIVKCIHGIEKKKQVNPLLFKSAALESYKNYRNKFPISELPSTLDEKLTNEVCVKIHEEVCKHIEEGKL